MTKYKSLFSPNKQCNALQYICELLCQKKADFDNIRLPMKFWDSMPAWDRYFKKNLRRVAKLLKRYDERAIINVLRSSKFGNRYSIFTDFAESLMIVEQKKIDLTKAVEKSDIVRPDINSKPREQNVKRGILSKLSELD